MTKKSATIIFYKGKLAFFDKMRPEKLKIKTAWGNLLKII
jgi:hypothetical protein